MSKGSTNLQAAINVRCCAANYSSPSFVESHVAMNSFFVQFSKF